MILFHFHEKLVAFSSSLFLDYDLCRKIQRKKLLLKHLLVYSIVISILFCHNIYYSLILVRLESK